MNQFELLSAPTMIDQIIWSKNRPAQLDLLLRSQKEYVTGIASTLVLYSAQGEIFRKGYECAQKLHPDVMWLKETDFRQQLVRGMQSFSNDHLLGNSDDNVWTSQVDLTGIKFEPWVVALSLRLNPSVNYCQPAGLQMKPPTFYVDSESIDPPVAGYQCVSEAARGGLTLNALERGASDEIKENGPFPGMMFRWSSSDPRGCWGYPQPCDSNVYPRKWWIDLISRAQFHNPGSLEDWMNTHRDISKPYMRCYDRSKLVNICNNRVQTTSTCPSGTGWEPEILARNFLDKRRISMDPFRNLNPMQCHTSLPFIWEDA